jgi:hypothetical protein
MVDQVAEVMVGMVVQHEEQQVEHKILEVAAVAQVTMALAEQAEPVEVEL